LCRKIEDLQFSIEEASIDKSDFEVSLMLFFVKKYLYTTYVLVLGILKVLYSKVDFIALSMIFSVLECVLDSSISYVYGIHCVPKKTSPTFLTVT